LERSVLLKEWHKLLGVFVKDLDLLGQNTGRNVMWVFKAERDHSFLAYILAALQGEYL
jgi:hypothetical protein